MKVVWILEDNAVWLGRATEVIEQVGAALGQQFDLHVSRDIEWPPDVTPSPHLDTWPHIVILDDKHNSKGLRGLKAYEGIRRAEKEATGGRMPPRSAFVILWTAYPTEADQHDFLKAKRTDARLLTCDVKSKRALSSNLNICLERLQEEVRLRPVTLDINDC